MDKKREKKCARHSALFFCWLIVPTDSSFGGNLPHTQEARLVFRFQTKAVPENPSKKLEICVDSPPTNIHTL